jgi:hypothetical protein
MSENNIKHFEILSGIDVSDRIESKKTSSANLNYLSWTWAWSETKKKFPNAKYDIIKNEKGLPYFYDENTGYIVYTWVEIEGIRHDMWLPVMDGSNKAMKAKDYKYKTKYGEKEVTAATMFDINKTLMRCLTKNLAMFGMGLYIYAGEDLPEHDKDIDIDKKIAEKDKNKKDDVGKDSKKEDSKPEYTDAIYKVLIFNTLYKVYSGNETEVANNLEELTAFKIKDKDTGEDKEISGVKDVNKLSSIRLKCTYGKIKKLYENELEEVKKDLKEKKQQAG